MTKQRSQKSISNISDKKPELQNSEPKIKSKKSTQNLPSQKAIEVKSSIKEDKSQKSNSKHLESEKQESSKHLESLVPNNPNPIV